MKALVYVAPEKVEIQNIREPDLREGDVLLRVRAAGICGSDVHGFLGHSERRKPPLVLGHEGVATIERIRPSRKDGLKPGQRVCINPLISCGMCKVCREGRQNLCPDWRLLGMDRLAGTYAELVAVPAAQLHPISDQTEDRLAVLTEPLANIVHFFRVAVGPLPETMIIFGAGTIGALTLLYAKLKGVPRVVVIDRVAERLEAARQLGADEILDSSNADGLSRLRQSAEVVVDAVGVADIRRAGLTCCRRGGRMVLVGLAENESSLPFIEMIRNEQSLHTTFAYTPADFTEALRLIEAHQVNLQRWTEIRSLEEGQEAFEKMAHQPGATLKLVFRL